MFMLIAFNLSRLERAKTEIIIIKVTRERYPKKIFFVMVSRRKKRMDLLTRGYLPFVSSYFMLDYLSIFTI